MDTCFVTAKLTAKKGMEAQLEAEVVKNIPNVRAEKAVSGTISIRTAPKTARSFSMRSGKARKPSTPMAKPRTCWPTRSAPRSCWPVRPS